VVPFRKDYPGFKRIKTNLKSGDGAGVFGGFTLVVIEISGDGDDRAVDGLSQILFSDVF
jgi:hypothetical protein